MAGTRIQALYNANAYINGENLAGLLSECTTPEIKFTKGSYSPLSGISKIDLATGLESMTLKMKWATVANSVIKSTGNPFETTQLMIRSNRDNYVNGNRVSSEPVVAMIQGLSNMMPGFDFKQQELVGVDTEWTATAYRLVIGNDVIFDIDIFAQILIVDGVDLMADYRANLGL